MQKLTDRISGYLGAPLLSVLKVLWRLVLLSTLLCVAACGDQISPQAAPTNSSLIIIKNGTIVDGLGSKPIQDGIVVIAGDRIKYVGRREGFSIPSKAQVIDAHGGTILPGIIDAHVHGAASPAIRRQFLVSGVTSVCDLGSSLGDVSEFEEDSFNQSPVARGFHAGPILTAPGGLPGAILGKNLNYEVGTPQEARAAVIDLHQRGADYIKVYLHQEDGGVTYPMITREQLAAIVDEAHARGLLVRAHVSYASLLEMAVEAGVDVIEHVPANATQAEAKSIPEIQWQALLNSDDPIQLFFTALYPDYEELLMKMVKAGIVLVPTLDSYMDLLRDSTPTPQDEAGIKIVFGIVRRFHDLGGTVGLGSDFIVGEGKPMGMPVGEMEMLQKAGLMPMEVIEAGTHHAAAICGHGSELGTLEPGKLAYLVIVDGDPLQNLLVMSRVSLVIQNGEIVVTSERVGAVWRHLVIWRYPGDLDDLMDPILRKTMTFP
jgi:imidazolonepropionase-like amidohydrolase